MDDILQEPEKIRMKDGLILKTMFRLQCINPVNQDFQRRRS